MHLALALRVPELAISDAEAMALAEAMLRCEAEFNVTVPPKLQAVMGMFSVAGAIYGPRFAAAAARVTTTRQRAREAARNPHGFGNAAPMPTAQGTATPPPAPATGGAPGAAIATASGTRGANVVNFTTGAPDRGRIDFGPG